MKKKFLAIICVFVLSTLTLTGCGRTAADKTASENGIPSWPLLGTSDNNPVARPVVSIKIENSADARPQTGLEKADIVWEEIAEGGIPRYIAQYNSVLPTEVAPVRSIRPVDSLVVAPEKSVLAASGGQARFLKLVKKYGTQVLTMDSGSSAFWRNNSGKPAPHNVSANIAKILKSIDKSHNNNAIPQFSYAPDVASSSTQIATDAAPALKVNIKMASSSNPVWKYDATTQKYTKYEGSTVQKVTSGKNITATNVLILTVNETTAGGLDPAGNPIPTYDLKGTGTGYLAVGGKYLKIKWSKPTAADIITLTVASTGESVTLAPGNTFVELQPSTGSVKIK